ncbi:MAG: MarR family transcriptional regulator [Oscillospiraceae bacterium]
MQEYIKGAEAISLFCRINMNMKRDLPVRASEMGMLFLIVKSAQPQSPIKIAEFFKVTKPMVTAMTNSLVKKGYLIKTPSSTDRRSFTLQPTTKAVSLVEEAHNEYFRMMETLKRRMGCEKYDQLIALIELANSILLEDN